MAESADATPDAEHGPDHSDPDHSDPDHSDPDQDRDKGAGENPADAGAQRSRRTGGRRQLPILIALTVVAVVLIGLGLVFWLRMLQHDADQARRQEALRTADDVAITLTTLDHRDADRDLRRLQSVATPQFAQQFGIISHAFADTVRKSQITSTGQVTSSGIQHIDDRSARVLVAVHATVRDARTPQGQPRSYRLGVDLVRQDDKWLVSNVEFIL